MNKNNKDQEILKPAKLNLVTGKDADKVVLQTPGQIKSEMGRVYRAVLKGRLAVDVGGQLIRSHLLPMLKAVEIEQEFNLAADDPDDDTPALTGLVITGPETAPQEGAPKRSLDGNEIKTIEPTKPERKDDEEETDDSRTKPRT